MRFTASPPTQERARFKTDGARASVFAEALKARSLGRTYGDDTFLHGHPDRQIVPCSRTASSLVAMVAGPCNHRSKECHPDPRMAMMDQRMAAIT